MITEACYRCINACQSASNKINTSGAFLLGFLLCLFVCFPAPRNDYSGNSVLLN